MDYGASVCFSCMRGSFSDRNGSTSCQLSAAGSYVQSTGQTTSIVCSTGTFQFMGGSSACIQCATGHFQTASGATACSACLPGYNQRERGASRCTHCDKGKFSWEEGSVGCTDCEPGSFQEVSASTSCSRCEKGFSQANKGQDHCVICMEGKFQISIGGSVCSECPQGTYQDQKGGTVCMECPTGTYQTQKSAPKQQDCILCPEGAYNNVSGMTSCIRCTAGTYASLAGSTQCQSCDAGTFQTSTASSMCQACPPGTAGKDKGQSTETECVSCPKGSFGANLGQTTCQPCHAGAFQPSQGASTCLNCTPGTYVTESGWSEDSCHKCKAGTFLPDLGASDESACVQCLEGHYSTMQGAWDIQACAMCPRGTISTKSRSECADCERGTFCPEGSGAPIECRDEHLDCNGSHLLSVPGFLPLFHAPNCTGTIPCPPGSECHAHPLEGDGIMERAVGQTHIVVFEDGPNSTHLSCEGKNQMTYGYNRVDWPDYSDARRGHKILFRLQPEGCLAGSFLKDSICEPCPAGTFLNNKGALDVSECLVCPEGKYTTSNGSTLCVDCSQGSYRALSAENTCLTCNPGTFQDKTGKTSCTRCRAGTFVNSTGASVCQACPAGTAQAMPGSQGCEICGPTQFSDWGDPDCSQCWSTPSPETHSLACQNDVSALPEQVDSVWITTTGDSFDECIGRGETEKKVSYAGLHQKIAVFGQNLTCKHTMRFMGRPDLTQGWTTTHLQLQRPVLLKVVPHNDTFYPALCAKHGLSVAFYVKDAEENSITNLSESEAVLSYVDPLSGDLLFWTVCNQLPRTVHGGHVIALGYCHTNSFCPVTDVEARVTLSWPGGNSVQGRHTLRVGKWMPCPPSSSWLTYVELVEPSIPFFTGDTMHVRIRTVEAPSKIVGFRFQLQLSIVAEIQEVSSVFAISYELEDRILTVQGDNVALSAYEVLCELKIKHAGNSTGLYGILKTIPKSFQLRMEDHFVYEPLIRTQGFTCGDDQGVLIALTETPRITSIIAESNRKQVIYWKALQQDVSIPETLLETVGVWNTPTQDNISLVNAECVSLDTDYVRVDSCSRMRAHTARGLGGMGRILVETNGVTTVISVRVLIPSTPSIKIITSLDGLSGRFKVLVRLMFRGSDEMGHLIDATPFILAPNNMEIVSSSGVEVEGEEWVCIDPTQNKNFSVGEPVLFSGTCSIKPQYRKGLVPFLFTGGYGGMHGFVFGRSVLHPKTPVGTLLLFSVEEGLLWSSEENSHELQSESSDISNGRILIARDRISLLPHAKSPRCIPLLFSELPRYPISIAVFPAAPASLHVILSTYVLVTQHDIGEVLPSQADIIEAWITLSNNEKYDVMGHTGLKMHTDDDLDIIPAVGIKSRMTGGVFSVIFKMEGMHCFSYSATVRVHPYSITSAELECPRCPHVLTTEDDPLSILFPMLFVSSIPMEWFVLKCTLVDGSRRDKLKVHLTVEGSVETRNERITGTSQGVLRITTPLARKAFEMQVIQRWGKDLELLCNGVGCVDPGVFLTPPGDGAALAPFGYSTTLTITARFVLVNHTTFVSEIPPDMTLYSNNKQIDPITVPLLKHELIELSLYIPEAWKIASTAVSIWVHALKSMHVDGPRILYQIHCSGVWEQGSYQVTGELSDGVREELHPLFTTTDGDNMKPASPDASNNAFIPETIGEETINVTFGSFTKQIVVIATVSSKYVQSVRLDFMPLNWNTPLETPLALEPVLDPVFYVENPRQLWKTILTWQASENGIVEWGTDGDKVTLLSDYYQPIDIIAVLAKCENVHKKHFFKRVNVNVVPNRAGQIDLGAEKGPPLPVVAVGNILPIPVYLFSDSKLFSYNIKANFEKVALYPAQCSPGEFPGGICELTESHSFLLTGRFHESQRSGRILVGIIHGRVMLDTLSHVQVAVQGILADNSSTTTSQNVSEYTPPTVFRFAVKTGNTQVIITPHQRFLTEINPVSNMHDPHVFLDEDPSSLIVCCNVTTMKPRMRLGRVFPSTFTLERVQVSWNDDKSVSEIDMMDPRLQIEFDKTLMEFTASPSALWTILDTGHWGMESTTAIKVVYTHPGTLGKLNAMIMVTLAEVEDIVLEPAMLELRRIHCSKSLFQSNCVTPMALLRNGLGRIKLKEGDILSARSHSTAVRIETLFGTQVCVNAISTGVSNVSVSLSDQVFKTFQVTVLDASVTISRLFLPNPLKLSSCRGGYAILPLMGYTQEDFLMQNLERFGAFISSAPVKLLKSFPSSLYVSVLDSTGWGQTADTITITLPACENQTMSSVTSRVHVRIEPCIDWHRPADVITRTFEDHIQLSLVGLEIASFFIHFRVEDQEFNEKYQCITGKQVDQYLVDCAVVPAASYVDIMIAGNQSADRRGLETTTDLVSLSPRPSVMWGFVEVFASGKVTRFPVDAGRIGTPTESSYRFDPIRALMPDLPVIDTAGLQKRDSTLPLHGADPLFLMTGRQRLIDLETYSNDHELSIMFKVTDRFLIPDKDSCKITCTVEDVTGMLPLLPGAVRRDNGDQTVTAIPVQDGWYAIQTDGVTAIPGLDLILKSIQVETSSSHKPWEMIVDEPERRLHVGTKLHECPRTATDKARFLIEFRISLQPLSQAKSLVNALVCTLHVAARRISIETDKWNPAWSRLSVSVESFVRVRQIREIVLNPSFSALLNTFATKGNRSLFSRRGVPKPTPVQVLEVERIMYIDDISDGNISCPPGTFFSRNGTYQKLPEHAQAGIDCYGMVCNNGYEAVSNTESGWTTCIPVQVSPDVAWVCVTIILSLLAFVVCLICCVKLSRSAFPTRSPDLFPAPLSAVVSEEQNGNGFLHQPRYVSDEDPSVHPAFDSRRWGSITEVILDDHSQMMLEGEFSPVPREEPRRYTS